MAVVPILLTLSNPRAVQWEMPGNYEGLRSPIPLGLIVFSGTVAVATLVSGDETYARIVMNMPAGSFAFLPRNYMAMFQSDGLQQGFETTGFGFYAGRAAWVTNEEPRFSLTSVGEIINGAITALQIWNPAPGSPKLMLLPGEQMHSRFADMTSAGSTAGDLSVYAEFYVFKVDQIDKWELNTPIPVIQHTSF